MTERKSLTVHYRWMDDPIGALNGATLEAALRSALLHRIDGGALSEHWNRRAWIVPPDSTDTMLMNIFHDDGVSFFGDLTVYTRGFMQALLHNEQDVAMLTVEQQPPPAGREYIHSMMYWMAIGNHRGGRVSLNSDWPQIGGSSAGVVSHAGPVRHGRRA